METKIHWTKQPYIQWFRLLQDDRVYKVRAGTMAENKTMIELAVASGMSHEATLRGEYLVEGRRIDRLQFSRFADSNDFQREQKKMQGR